MPVPFLLLEGVVAGIETSVTQLTVEYTQTLPGELRVTDLAVEHAYAPPASQTRATQLTVEIIRQRREVLFADATVFVGITWIEVTTRSGAFYVWSDRPLPDPITYYGGWKAPRVIQWGRIRRALSGFDGQYETSDFSVTFSDTDRLLRGLDDAGELLNATVIVRMITDEGRRALQTPRVAYRGIIREARPTSTLTYDVRIKDPFAEQFAAGWQSDLIPRRVITTDDFPNCALDTIPSSAEGYVVDGAYTAGSPAITSVNVRDGDGQFAPGDRITFADHTTIYTVSDGS